MTPRLRTLLLWTAPLAAAALFWASVEWLHAGHAGIPASPALRAAAFEVLAPEAEPPIAMALPHDWRRSHARAQRARYRLDVELGRIYSDLQRQRWLDSIAGRRYIRAAHQLHALFIDVNEITDKTENALKMVGDIYAARLFNLTAARFGLARWKESVQDKLKTLDDIYRFAVEQVAISRGHLLELTIILILVLELVLFFLGIMT